MKSYILCKAGVSQESRYSFSNAHPIILRFTSPLGNTVMPEDILKQQRI